MNDNYIENETTDIISSLDTIDSLIFAYKILEKITCFINNDLFYYGFKKEDLKKLIDSKLLIKEVINNKESEG